MIRLIATDMDGTLLDAEKKLPRALPQLLQELYRRDIVFAIASGRSRIALTSLFGDLAASLIFICDNGGYIQIPGQAPLLHSMQPEAVHTVLDLCRQLHQVVPVLCCQHDIYYPQSAQEQFQNEINNFYKQFQHCPYEALYDIAKQDPVLKIALCDMAGPMQKFHESPRFRKLLDGCHAGRHRQRHGHSHPAKSPGHFPGGNHDVWRFLQ